MCVWAWRVFPTRCVLFPFVFGLFVFPAPSLSPGEGGEGRNLRNGDRVMKEAASAKGETKEKKKHCDTKLLQAKRVLKISRFFDPRVQFFVSRREPGAGWLVGCWDTRNESMRLQKVWGALNRLILLHRLGVANDKPIEIYTKKVKCEREREEGEQQANRQHGVIGRTSHSKQTQQALRPMRANINLAIPESDLGMDLGAIR